MENFPLKGVGEIVSEGNNYLTAYQSVLKKSNGLTISNETDYQDHPLATTSSSERHAATTTLTTPDDDEMIDITPHSSPGDVSHHLNTYSRGSTADNSDMERERGDYSSHHNHPHHSNNSQQHQRIHQHVPTHSAFGDSMDVYI